VHDNGVALDELALVDQHTLRDLPQHGCKATVPSARQQRCAQRASRLGARHHAEDHIAAGVGGGIQDHGEFILP
jgi:hypothetical protein